MGRQRKTTSTTKKHLTKKEMSQRANQEKKIKLDRDDLKVPEWMQDDLLAHNEFVRVVNSASQIDLWDNLDLSILAIYCKSYSGYITVTKLIDENGFTVPGKESEKISPYVTAQSRYVEQILKCSSKLGLATTDRLKLIVPEGDTKDNKFTKYIVV